jgi:sugar lactone lactonase YvrE
MRLNRRLLVTTTTIALLVASTSASGPPGHDKPIAKLLVSGLASGSGSTVGPDGALYVTEGATGRVLRVNPRNGNVSTFASELPPILPAIGIGGAMDVAFIGHTAYVLVALVSPEVGGADPVGIYRIDGPSDFSVIADIGAFSLANPPETDFFVPIGVQYAMQPYGGGFLVTDGHHNRVLRVRLNGRISEFMTFDNIVPTGLELFGPIVLMAQAGPVPHLPEDGKIVAFAPRSSEAVTLGTGAPLMVDVEFGRGGRLYGLSQGVFTPGNPEGSPADPDTGALVELKPNGRFKVVVDQLNQPTSLEFIGDTAYVITLGGEIWKIDNVSR